MKINYVVVSLGQITPLNGALIPQLLCCVLCIVLIVYFKFQPVKAYNGNKQEGIFFKRNNKMHI